MFRSLSRFYKRPHPYNPLSPLCSWRFHHVTCIFSFFFFHHSLTQFSSCFMAVHHLWHFLSFAPRLVIHSSMYSMFRNFEHFLKHSSSAPCLMSIHHVSALLHHLCLCSSYMAMSPSVLSSFNLFHDEQQRWIHDGI